MCIVKFENPKFNKLSPRIAVNVQEIETHTKPIKQAASINKEVNKTIKSS